MQNKICIITGGNTGIGRATATALAQQGASVVIVCRSKERGEEARTAIVTQTQNKQVELVLADLASLASVRAAATQILERHARIDVLVNNAGIFAPAREITPEGFEKTFVTNYLSHYLFTRLLLPRLEQSTPARIVNVASKSGGAKLDFADLQSMQGKYSTLTAVSRTKLAQVMFTKELARRAKGVTANAVHPGLVKTPLLDDMNPWLRRFFHLMSMPPEKGARTAVFLATSPDVATITGKMFEKNREIAVSPQAKDEAATARLWDDSAKLCALA